MTQRQVQCLMDGNGLMELCGNLYEFIGIEDRKKATDQDMGRRGDYIFSDIVDGYPVWVPKKALLKDSRYEFVE